MGKKRNIRHNVRPKPLLHFVKPMIITLLVSIGLGFGVWYLALAKPIGFLKINITWNIDSQLPITATTLKSQIKPLITRTYWLDLNRIKHSLEQNPWVEQANIKRLLWNRVKISITAKSVAMRWKNPDCKTQNAVKNCTGYVSTSGVLFIPQHHITSTATIALTKPNPAIITQLYKDYQHYQKLANPMIIKSFAQTNIQTLTFKPDIKVVLGTQKQQQRLLRFLKAYKKLRKKTKKAQNATFDMRYPKGFSVRY